MQLTGKTIVQTEHGFRTMLEVHKMLTEDPDHGILIMSRTGLVSATGCNETPNSQTLTLKFRDDTGVVLMEITAGPSTALDIRSWGDTEPLWQKLSKFDMGQETVTLVPEKFHAAVKDGLATNDLGLLHYYSAITTLEVCEVTKNPTPESTYELVGVDGSEIIANGIPVLAPEA